MPNPPVLIKGESGWIFSMRIHVQDPPQSPFSKADVIRIPAQTQLRYTLLTLHVAYFHLIT